MLAPDTVQIMQSASTDAHQRNHAEVGIEHVVMAVIARANAARILEECGAKLGKLAAELDRYLDERPLQRDGQQLQASPELNGALQRAARHMQGVGLTEITIGNLLVAMLAEKTAFAVAALARHGVTRFGVMSYLVHGSRDSSAALPEARLVSRWKPWARVPAPDRCEIVMFNDPYTQMEFVIDVLMSVFDHDRDDAHALMTAIHERGSGVVGSYSFTEAMALVAEVTKRAQRNEFPLKVSIVPTTTLAR